MRHYGLFGGVPATNDPALLKLIDGYGRGLKKPPIPGASDIWAIGRVDLADGRVVDQPLSWEDIDRDIAFAGRILDLMGVKSGDLCFYSFLYGQSAQFWPFMKATYDRGGHMGSGMPTAWDSYRLETYLRLFRMKLHFGATSALLDGLEGAGHDLAKVFAGAETVVAFPGAWERLAAKGVKPWRAFWLGPTLAVDLGDGGGGRFDASQWTLDSDHGEILITSAPSRLGAFHRARTGAKGEIRLVEGEPRYFAS